MNIVETQHLTKFYGKTRGIIDVSFSVEEGELFGFIGPNGAGKSTTIRTLLSLIYPTSGHASIFGKDCVRFSSDIKKEVGYLPSEVFYYDYMKAIDLLHYSASFYHKDCTKRIHELAEILDLNLNRRIDDLSFGNRKKVGIIQGLLHSPRLIILDEPTGGLDPLMQQNFFSLLREENKKGCTILFSSHILNEVQKMCKRVAIIKEGRIIKLENVSNLIENTYKRIKIETNQPVQISFLHLPGILNIVQEDQICSFLYQGNINQLIHQLSEVELTNMTMEDPSLEEVFMHFYEKEGTL